MKILIIGGNGTIGKKVTTHLINDHDVLVAGRTNTEHPVDITNIQSIKALFKKTGQLDAIICIAGEAKWDYFDQLTEADYHIGLNNKLMGQVNLVRLGQNHLKPSGSITLSTGILADDPVVKTASAAMVNGAIHSFVKAAALELKNGHRLNAVSSGMVEDAFEKYHSYFPGHNAIPMHKVVNGYVRSVIGKDNGKVIRIYD